MKHTRRRMSQLGNQQGFTLPEMTIAILIALMVMAGVTGVFLAHARHYNQQDDTAELQQNLRGVMSVMAADLRLTGCDMANGGRGGIQDVRVSGDNVTISGEGTCKQIGGEARAYCYQYDAASSTLLRSSESSCKKDKLLPLAENIAGMELNFCIEGKECRPDKPTAKDLNRVTAIQLAVLAKAAKPSQDWVPPGYNARTKTGEIKSPSGKSWPIKADNRLKTFARHKLLVTTVQMRNLAMRQGD